MARIEFITREFEFSHGRAPRGRGSWAFAKDPDVDPGSDQIMWSPSMTYTEAKKWARQEAGRRGLQTAARIYGDTVIRLYVLP